MVIGLSETMGKECCIGTNRIFLGVGRGGGVGGKQFPQKTTTVKVSVIQDVKQILQSRNVYMETS